MQKDFINSNVGSVSSSGIKISCIFVNRWSIGRIGIRLNSLLYYANDKELNHFIRGDIRRLKFVCTKPGISSLILHSKKDSNGIFMIYDDEYFVSSKFVLNKILTYDISVFALGNIKLLDKKKLKQ